MATTKMPCVTHHVCWYTWQIKHAFYAFLCMLIDQIGPISLLPYINFIECIVTWLVSPEAVSRNYYLSLNVHYSVQA